MFVAIKVNEDGSVSKRDYCKGPIDYAKRLLQELKYAQEDVIEWIRDQKTESENFKIVSAILYWPGDHSVGISGRTLYITDYPLIDLSVYAEQNRIEVLEEFRTKLADAFEVIEDGRPQVTFDFEY